VPYSGLDCLICAMFAGTRYLETDVEGDGLREREEHQLDECAPRVLLPLCHLRTTTSEKCAAVPRRARI